MAAQAWTKVNYSKLLTWLIQNR